MVTFKNNLYIFGGIDNSLSKRERGRRNKKKEIRREKEEKTTKCQSHHFYTKQFEEEV
jgi:hypothetical protein